jgi:hypothetical protein
VRNRHQNEVTLVWLKGALWVVIHADIYLRDLIRWLVNDIGSALQRGGRVLMIKETLVTHGVV